MGTSEKILKYEVNLLLHRKKRMVFFSIDKFRLASENLDLRKFVYSTVSLTASQYSKASDEISSIIHKLNF